MKTSNLLLWLAPFLSLYQTAAFANSPDVLRQHSISLSLANKLITETMSVCHAKGHHAVVVVLDRSGSILALQRDNDVGPHNIDAARKKAFTALSTKVPSRQFAENIRNNPESANLNTVDSLLLIGGGVPIKIDTEIIGAIAVGGAGGAANDEECALKALATVMPTVQK
jgi:uncharacterized protein GlcG (DUF336 family)